MGVRLLALNPLGILPTAAATTTTTPPPTHHPQIFNRHHPPLMFHHHHHQYFIWQCPPNLLSYPPQTACLRHRSMQTAGLGLLLCLLFNAIVITRRQLSTRACVEPLLWL
jgi:hypothetical protein